MLRASYGTGFLAPNVSQLVPGATTSTYMIIDPQRGNQSESVTGLSGGNPNLRPEKSKSWSAGIVFTPSGIPGLRTSIDYTRINKTDNIATLSIQQVVSNEALFPGRVTRSAALPGDPYGIGPINLVDLTNVNISSAQFEALDGSLDYTF